ncbi:hypothetical protein Tco_0602140, partial [Tanacetum coccineum]
VPTLLLRIWLFSHLRILAVLMSGDFEVSTAGEIIQVPSTPCAHDVAYSFLAKPTTSPQLENEDFQQMDEDDLKELDLRWQVAMLTVRVKKSGRNQGRRYYGDNGRSNAPTNESSSQALVAQDGLGGYDWSNDFEVEPVNYALIAISSSSSLSSSDKLEKVVKERDELKDKIAKWEESSKNLDEILNSQMSARDKTDNTPENDRFSKNGYKAVPPPITGNFLTPRADISFTGLDEYAIRNKIIESQTTELNIKTSETVGKTNDANTEKPKSVSESVVSNPKINRDSVIIEDWNSDDEEEGPSVSTARPSVSTARPVCTARPSISTARPSISTARPSVSTARPSINTVRPVNTASPSISTARLSISTARPSISTARPSVSTARPSINTARPVNIGFGGLREPTWIMCPKTMDHSCSRRLRQSRDLTMNDFNGGFCGFGSESPKGDELKFNLFSVSQMCDKKNSVLFTESECLILSPSFKLLDEIDRMEGITIEEYLAMEERKMAKQSVNSSFDKLWYLADEDEEEESYLPISITIRQWIGTRRMQYGSIGKKGDDEEVFTYDELFDLEEEDLNEGNEIAEVIDIDCYFAGDLPGFKTYEDYKNAWIYEWNNEVLWDEEKPWLEDGIWKKPIDDICHEYKPFRIAPPSPKLSGDSFLAFLATT